MIEEGINSISISKLAKAAGISKGSFYDYFTNKNDLVFEIINISLLKHNTIKEEKLNNVKTSREKVKVFLEIFYEEEDDELRNLYKEFLSISLSEPTKDIIDYHTRHNEEYYLWFKSIFDEGIEKNELKPEAAKLISGLFLLGTGVFISQLTCKVSTNSKKEIDNYVDTIFDLIEINKCN
eukprot:Anaeramoba_ignava/a483834_17.p2 GENE.a483834_17~~a483834_17.p2  ORF type:complete len:180 (-),score=5.02 a483834_17:967-1506(-)